MEQLLTFLDSPDPRTKHLPLLGNPLHLSLITAAWLWFVLRAGPRFMSDRKPFALTRFIQVLNVVQILANAFVVHENFAAGWLKGYNLSCVPCNRSSDPDVLRIARATYVIFTLKVLDLADTVIYVLRRKESQVTFLHMFHHINTLVLGWFVTNYVPVGQALFTQTLNASIHVIMYSYYFTASLGPHFQKYLWWKKYLTRLQMVQFVLQFVHALHTLFVRPDCDFPRFIALLFLPSIVTIFGLFANFYLKSYDHKHHVKKE